MTRIRNNSSNQRRNLFSSPLFLTLVAGILGAIVYKVYINDPNNGSLLGSSLSSGTGVDFKITNTQPVKISTGKHRNIPYYFCTGKRASYEDVVNIVLLHGAKYTKEDWKSSGLLEKFCNVRRLSVMAMDLPVSADHEQLFKMLRTLSNDGYISEIPVALVTPSASGFAVSDWIENDDIEKLPMHVKHWIPVASGSVKKVPDDKLKAIGKIPKDEFSILAIYGNEDKGGKAVSHRLNRLAGAEMVELEGGHPCYLDSPDAFVATVVKHLGLQLPN